MTTTLRQVLNAFRAANAPLSLAQLARQLAITPAMAEDMIQYWVRKGKLRENIDSGACNAATPGCSCGSGANGCPFVILMPRSYELVE